jgi:hypothetical protein
MKFLKVMSVLLKEGRKEDLKKKYSDKFKEYPDTLDFVLGISDLADSNYKYTDFVLKNLHPNSSTDEVEDAVELVKDFEQFSGKLQIKDINQYRSFEQLQGEIQKLKEVKKPKPESERIYEDDKFLVIKPKNEEASCKYGANTKWCVTSYGSGHFARYTSDNQGLYFIINKTNSTNQNYSKVAIHFDDNGHTTYWDTQDMPMTKREVDVMEYAFPEVIESIKADYKKTSVSKMDKFLERVFNSYGEKLMKIENYLSSGLSLECSIVGFESTDRGHATASLVIWLTSPNGDHRVIDSYEVYVLYEPHGERSVEFGVSFAGDDDLTGDDVIDLGLENHDLDAVAPIPSSYNIASDAIKNYILKNILNYIKDNPELTQKVAGTSKVWRPDRANYGYTFEKNKGLIKKLVDYLDAGTIGTKLDFLESIGKLNSKIVNGKKLYSHLNTNNYLPSSQFRGQFSSFFASAKMAGILNYTKVGNGYFLTKGPNFDTFKSGELKTV